jgi:hypothetical protein
MAITHSPDVNVTTSDFWIEHTFAAAFGTFAENLVGLKAFNVDFVSVA